VSGCHSTLLPTSSCFAFGRAFKKRPAWNYCRCKLQELKICFTVH